MVVLAGPALHLLLHVPAGCSTFPARSEQSILPVSAIVANDAPAGVGDDCLPIVPICGNAEELQLPDGNSYLWLRGDRAFLLERAAALRSTETTSRPSQGGLIASLPIGACSSVSELSRAAILAWQLHTTYRCRAVVLPWPELEAAAAAAADIGGWDAIACQLIRMREPEWTVIQGG